MKVFFSLLVTFPMIWVLISLYFPSGATIGHVAAPFTATLIDGKEIRIKDLRGKVVVLNFWASWCLPCQEEVRGLQSTWKKHQNKKVVFLGVNVKNDDERDARRYIKKYGITYPNAWDDGGISQRYSVWGIPKTFIVGRKGKITYVHLGSLCSAQLEAKVAEAQKGVVTTREGRGAFQSLNAVRIEELAKLLETSRNAGRAPPIQPAPRENFRRIEIDDIGLHRGQWIRISFKDGLKREGRVVKVKQRMIQLEEILNVGTLTFHVPIHEIAEVELLISGDQANSRGS